MEGAESLVRTADRLGIAMALVTSSDRESVQRKIANHPWVNLLQLMICGDDPRIGAGKPAPDPFLTGAECLGVRPEDCWAFEDSQAGCRSALTAGCMVWRLLRTHQSFDVLTDQPEDLEKTERLISIHRLSEAEACLKMLSQ